VRIVLALVLCLIASSCSRIPGLFVINGSGVSIEILSVIEIDESGFEYAVRGRSERLVVPHGARSGYLLPGGDWRLQIERAGCRLWYVIAPPANSYGDLYVQLARDVRLRVVEESQTEREHYRLVQVEGFPLLPEQVHCPQ
jgi:hypothetical protein